MPSAPINNENNYWLSFQVNNEDLDFIKNHLFELETPQKIEDLLQALVLNRIKIEKASLANQQSEKGRLYLPKDNYQMKERIVFSCLNWETGVVLSVRPAFNPEQPPFNVIEVGFKNKQKRNFASGFENHPLNNPQESMPGMEYLDPDHVMKTHGADLATKLKNAIREDNDLVSSADLWFHRSLLLDINPGQLNLAEAVLDMAGGGPLTTNALASQLDLSSEGNPALLEFSLNRALMEDPRFDEVGPTGEIVWFLEKLEPDDVRSMPLCLQYKTEDIDHSLFSQQMLKATSQLDDEFATPRTADVNPGELQLVLTYPHWRAGTLPISNRTDHLFPTAFESPRIKFQFVDADSKTPFSGWVVRTNRYAAGLRQWYLDNGVVPGSIVTVKKADHSGNVIISANKRRPTKEWVRTAIVGADGGIVLALLKQQVTTACDEQMTTIIPDTEALDRVWNQIGKARLTNEQAILRIARELTKLNPQGHIHAIELYSTVNVVKRIPVDAVFDQLIRNPAFSHVGDLYYRLDNEVPVV
ncbi:MAG: hypothetical protein C0391_01005 [Anaerolinea sp.]|nr:hypothetical protein [Anaerolinea sp.]